MLISDKNLINLPVYTRSGKHLGRVVGFEIDAETQSIIKYYVRSDSIIEHIIHNRELIIAHSQVVSIDRERMIVDDALGVEELKVKKERIPVPVREPVGVLGSGKE